MNDFMDLEDRPNFWNSSKNDSFAKPNLLSSSGSMHSYLFCAQILCMRVEQNCSGRCTAESDLFKHNTVPQRHEINIWCLGEAEHL